MSNGKEGFSLDLRDTESNDRAAAEERSKAELELGKSVADSHGGADAAIEKLTTEMAGTDNEDARMMLQDQLNAVKAYKASEGSQK